MGYAGSGWMSGRSLAPDRVWCMMRVPGRSSGWCGMEALTVQCHILQCFGKYAHCLLF